MSLRQVVKRYVEAPGNGRRNCVKVLVHQGTKVADRLRFVRADVPDDEPEVQRLTIGTNGVMLAEQTRALARPCTRTR